MIGDQMSKFLLSAVLLFSTSRCQAAVRGWQQERLLNHLSQIQNYHGTIVESGILDSKEDLVSEIWFEKPGHYLTVIQSPEKQAGVKIAYDGKTLQIYYPKSKFAILYKNLMPLSEADTQQIIKDQFKSNKVPTIS